MKALNMNIHFGNAPPPASGINAAQPVPVPEASASRVSAVPPQPRSQQAAAQAPLSGDAARQLARQINDFLKSSSSNVEFVVDGDSREVVVRVVDAQTGEIIRQIPSEEMLAISKSLDRMIGLLIQQKA